MEGKTMTTTAEKCSGGAEAHFAHIELNGECPWCGTYNAAQTDFGHIGEDGTVYAANGDVIEHGPTR